MIQKFIKWGDSWPIIYHAILFPPVGAIGASWSLLIGSTWYWAIATGLLVTIGVLFGQEYADQRAHDRIAEHHVDRPDEPEVWHGWDWHDIAGGVIGGIIGSTAVVLLRQVI